MTETNSLCLQPMAWVHMFERNYSFLLSKHRAPWNVSTYRALIYIVLQVWDVVSNQEAIQMVASTKERGKAAKRLVECAVRAWKKKRRGVAVDDCSAICLFFHSSWSKMCIVSSYLPSFTISLYQAHALSEIPNSKILWVLLLDCKYNQILILVQIVFT